MNEAMFWREAGNGTVRCALCPHNCKIAEGSPGLCGVRRNAALRRCRADVRCRVKL